MKLKRKTLLYALAAIALVAGGAVMPVASANALMIAKSGATGGKQFGAIPPRIELPQGKEELSLDDIRLAVENHLVGIGALDLKVGKIDKTPDGIAIVHIVNGQDDAVGEFGVDVATAQIFPQSQLQMLLGQAATDNCPAPQSAGLAKEDHPANNYRAKLRAHMMGDGQAWAPWLTDAAVGACQNDYRDGGPDIPQRGAMF